MIGFVPAHEVHRESWTDSGEVDEMRASFTGIEVKIAVPDHATAAIFRAALSETVRSRPTDRLVRVVVD